MERAGPGPFPLTEAIEIGTNTLFIDTSPGESLFILPQPMQAGLLPYSETGKAKTAGLGITFPLNCLTRNCLTRELGGPQRLSRQALPPGQTDMISVRYLIQKINNGIVIGQVQQLVNPRPISTTW